MSDAAFEQFADLEQALAHLAPHVAFPPTPDLAAAVRSQIAEQPPAQISRQPLWFRPRMTAVAAAALVILLGAALIASPGLRSSVAKRLGVHGIEIIFVEETPTPAATPVGATYLLGEQVTLEEAQARVDYVIQIPSALGAPDEVYIRQVSAGPMVTLLYRTREGLPAANETGVGALLMQFPATVETPDLVKRVTAGMGSMLAVDINGAPGFWVTGETTLVIDQDPSATFSGSGSRPSADVLIWELDGVTYRLEADVTVTEAIRIAESTRTGWSPYPE